MPTSNADEPSRPVPSASSWIAQCDLLVTRRGHRIAYRRRGCGPVVIALHGFPTWSYDFAAVAGDLAVDHCVITLDFLGYGASDKPAHYDYSVNESADIVEEVANFLGVESAHLVVHDYGGIVGQELIGRELAGRLSFAIHRVTMLNCGIVYDAYRPTRLQRLLGTPVLGAVIARTITERQVRSGLAAVWGSAKLTDAEFDELWRGISLNDGHKLAHRLIRYNAERDAHHGRWEEALVTWRGPLQLVWGLDDPVSGRHVLARAVDALPQAHVVELPGVGHFPNVEAPAAVSAAVRHEA